MSAVTPTAPRPRPHTMDFAVRYLFVMLSHRGGDDTTNKHVLAQFATFPFDARTSMSIEGLHLRIEFARSRDNIAWIEQFMDANKGKLMRLYVHHADRQDASVFNVPRWRRVR